MPFICGCSSAAAAAEDPDGKTGSCLGDDGGDGDCDGGGVLFGGGPGGSFGGGSGGAGPSGSGGWNGTSGTVGSLGSSFHFGFFAFGECL